MGKKLLISEEQSLQLNEIRKILDESRETYDSFPTTYNASCGGTCLLACDGTCWVGCTGSCIGCTGCAVLCQGVQ
jgi:hypothetical protein